MNSLNMLHAHIQKCLLNNIRLKHTWVKPEGYNTGINVYNCIAKEKVPLIVRNKDFVSWYTCGPTVYEAAHIGHASCYVKLDIIQRILRDYFKINVVTAMNITDIDDKIINKSNQMKVSTTELAQHYEKEFWEDMNLLKIGKPDIIIRVTENMAIIEDFIKMLHSKEYVYKDKSDSVVFDIKKSNYYGKLQNITHKDEVQLNNEPNVDFAVWKTAKENEPLWNATYGPGRPGWHTECASLASAIFGSCIDVHAGGIDLRFPHHENEEVQCCAFFSKSQWVNYWFHTGHLLQNSTKMSKSLSNTVSIRKMLETCNADVFRIMCLISHYRHNMEFTDDYVKTAESLFEMYRNFVADCNACINGKLKSNINTNILNSHLVETISKVECALKNDFDTSSCIKVINSLVTITNKMLHSPAANTNSDLSGIASLTAVLNCVTNIFNLFGVNFHSKIATSQEQGDIVEFINILIDFRQNVRLLGIQNKDRSLLELCDSVRDELKRCGVTVKDHGKVSSWSK